MVQPWVSRSSATPVTSVTAVGISLIKGIEFENGTPVLISDLLQKEMAKSEGSPKIDMSVLMGANVANEVISCVRTRAN